jgi:hypothetical protein
MNPYLENSRFWPDFHNAYLTYLRSVIRAAVPSGYFVQLQERIYLRDLDEEDDRPIGIGDVNVGIDPGAEAGRKWGKAAGVTAPAVATLPRYARESVNFLEVLDRDEQTVLTVLELLSPSNKATGDDRDSFLDKRRELITSRSSYIELDFLRGGPRLPLRRRPACDYYAMVSRPWKRPIADIWPVRLREPLPSIPIPLRRGEPEPLIDLQQVLHRTFDEAGYAPRLYRHAPQPPLPPDDAAWAAEIARAATPTA